MIWSRVAQPAKRHSHDHRNVAAPPIPNFRSVVDQLIEPRRDEVVELNLADRPLARQRRTDADAEDRALRQG